MSHARRTRPSIKKKKSLHKPPVVQTTRDRLRELQDFNRTDFNSLRRYRNMDQLLEIAQGRMMWMRNQLYSYWNPDYYNTKTAVELAKGNKAPPTVMGTLLERRQRLGHGPIMDERWWFWNIVFGMAPLTLIAAYCEFRGQYLMWDFRLEQEIKLWKELYGTEYVQEHLDELIAASPLEAPEDIVTRLIRNMRELYDVLAYYGSSAGSETTARDESRETPPVRGAEATTATTTLPLPPPPPPPPPHSALNNNNNTRPAASSSLSTETAAAMAGGDAAAAQLMQQRIERLEAALLQQQQASAHHRSPSQPASSSSSTSSPQQIPIPQRSPEHLSGIRKRAESIMRQQALQRVEQGKEQEQQGWWKQVMSYTTQHDSSPVAQQQQPDAQTTKQERKPEQRSVVKKGTAETKDNDTATGHKAKAAAPVPQQRPPAGVPEPTIDGGDKPPVVVPDAAASTEQRATATRPWWQWS